MRRFRCPCAGDNAQPPAVVVVIEGERDMRAQHADRAGLERTIAYFGRLLAAAGGPSLRSPRGVPPNFTAP
jgi:hypothetical protein